MDKKRTIRYLIRHYENFSEKNLLMHIDLIKNRLLSAGKWEQEILSEIIETLKEDKWSWAKIASHLDLLDIEDRT